MIDHANPRAPQPWRALLSPHAAAAEMSWLDNSTIDDGGLFPGERAAVEKAVAQRRAQFTAGRLCARRAMALLGRAAAELPVGPQRAPQWPAGLVGSISHVDGYCVAAVAPALSSRGLGVDVEMATGLDPSLWPLVITAADARWLAALDSLGGLDGPLAAKLIFSAKEAVFKCQFPLTQVWVDFLDVEIEPDPGAGIFHARFIKAAGELARGTTWLGRYSIDGARIHSVVELAA